MFFSVRTYSWFDSTTTFTMSSAKRYFLRFYFALEVLKRSFSYYSMRLHGFVSYLNLSDCGVDLGYHIVCQLGFLLHLHLYLLSQFNYFYFCIGDRLCCLNLTLIQYRPYLRYQFTDFLNFFTNKVQLFSLAVFDLFNFCILSPQILLCFETFQ